MPNKSVKFIQAFDAMSDGWINNDTIEPPFIFIINDTDFFMLDSQWTRIVCNSIEYPRNYQLSFDNAKKLVDVFESMEYNNFLAFLDVMKNIYSNNPTKLYEVIRSYTKLYEVT